jgi:hypothetical protein
MRPLSLLSALLCVALAGCGSSGDGGGGRDGGGGVKPDTETFAEGGFEITFDYPAEMQLCEDVSLKQSAGAEADETVALAFDEDDAIVVQRFDLNVEVTEDNVDDAKAELDGVISQLDPDAGSGEDLSLEGFEAFEYDLEPEAPPGARSRYVVLFAGDTEYVINCQATKERREDIAGACRTALETVRPAVG